MICIVWRRMVETFLCGGKIGVLEVYRANRCLRVCLCLFSLTISYEAILCNMDSGIPSTATTATAPPPPAGVRSVCIPVPLSAEETGKLNNRYLDQLALLEAASEGTQLALARVLMARHEKAMQLQIGAAGRGVGASCLFASASTSCHRLRS